MRNGPPWGRASKAQPFLEFKVVNLIHNTVDIIPKRWPEFFDQLVVCNEVGRALANLGSSVTSSPSTMRVSMTSLEPGISLDAMRCNLWPHAAVLLGVRLEVAQLCSGMKNSPLALRVTSWRTS